MTQTPKPKKTEPLRLEDIQLEPASTQSDQPVTWGDPEITDADVVAKYEANRPPHYGGD